MSSTSKPYIPQGDYNAGVTHDEFPVSPQFAEELGMPLDIYDMRAVGYLHPCGECNNTSWLVVVEFTDYEISSYSTEIQCQNCGAGYKTPCPTDHPDYVE